CARDYGSSYGWYFDVW
nr:immunoglobulin heavy chain junction region [Mus musculus]MBK4184357.1 immunoglobulin heavy chain junction region [Mus musculus]MBK4186130.1 immunoglobulin heavy chain junction region [Mus musculus]MBK4186131.1 immunoglobulin heavy chain junction region [Mus musculus]MBK4186134.1 immunoglobulin heavy chain junction region [Mus musculus]